jgi:hypothetical protein
MKKTTILAAIVASSTALTAFAHGGATGIVKDRMDAMAEMGKAVKAVTPMMRGEAAYDADVLRQAAATFSRHAGEAMTQLFQKALAALRRKPRRPSGPNGKSSLSWLNGWALLPKGWPAPRTMGSCLRTVAQA